MKKYKRLTAKSFARAKSLLNAGVPASAVAEVEKRSLSTIYVISKSNSLEEYLIKVREYYIPKKKESSPKVQEDLGSKNSEEFEVREILRKMADISLLIEIGEQQNFEGIKANHITAAYSFLMLSMVELSYLDESWVKS